MYSVINNPDIPDIPKNNNLATLSKEDKIDAILSIFENIENINGYTVIKLKPNAVICTESDLYLASGKNISIKTVKGNLYLN